MRVPRRRRGDLALPGAASRKAQTMLQREAPDNPAGVSTNGARTASGNESGAKPPKPVFETPPTAPCGRRGITAAARFLHRLGVDSPYRYNIFVVYYTLDHRSSMVLLHGSKMYVQLPDGHVISPNSGSGPHSRAGRPVQGWTFRDHLAMCRNRFRQCGRDGSMTGGPVRGAVGVFRKKPPLRGVVYAPPRSGLDRSGIGVPAGRRSIGRGVDSA